MSYGFLCSFCCSFGLVALNVFIPSLAAVFAFSLFSSLFKEFLFLTTAEYLLYSSLCSVDNVFKNSLNVLLKFDHLCQIYEMLFQNFFAQRAFIEM